MSGGLGSETRADLLYWEQRAADGDPAVDKAGNCQGCGRRCDRVAEGAAAGCAVCLAFCEWVAGPREDAGERVGNNR